MRNQILILCLVLMSCGSATGTNSTSASSSGEAKTLQEALNEGIQVTDIESFLQGTSWKLSEYSLAQTDAIIEAGESDETLDFSSNSEASINSLFLRDGILGTEIDDFTAGDLYDFSQTFDEYFVDHITTSDTVVVNKCGEEAQPEYCTCSAPDLYCTVTQEDIDSRNTCLETNDSEQCNLRTTYYYTYQPEAQDSVNGYFDPLLTYEIYRDPETGDQSLLFRLYGDSYTSCSSTTPHSCTDELENYTLEELQTPYNDPLEIRQVKQHKIRAVTEDYMVIGNRDDYVVVMVKQ